MAEIAPLHALHYAPSAAGRLQELVAPPYDVIDVQQRADLAGRSPWNVVHVDLPQPAERSVDRYAHAAATLAAWTEQGIVVRDERPAIWALSQEYVAPDGRRLTRNGFLCRVRVTPYGAGRIRPHERTHPGPKQDRLDLTRATRTNLSPIFGLCSDRATSHGARSSPTSARPRRSARRPTPTARSTASGGSPTPTRSRRPSQRSRPPSS